MPAPPWSALQSPSSVDGAVTVVASRPELRRLREVPSFPAAVLRIRRQLLGSPGARGLSLIARPLRKPFWTLSAWQGQAALRAAASGKSRRQIMNRFRPRTAGSRSVTWAASATALPTGWNGALRRPGHPDTSCGRSLSGRAAATGHIGDQRPRRQSETIRKAGHDRPGPGHPGCDRRARQLLLPQRRGGALGGRGGQPPGRPRDLPAERRDPRSRGARARGGPPPR